MKIRLKKIPYFRKRIKDENFDNKYRLSYVQHSAREEGKYFFSENPMVLTILRMGIFRGIVFSKKSQFS